jgi:hypothetical protein
MKKIRFFQPVRLSIYPKRTRNEIKLIDKNPFGDYDKDRVPNLFDCRPMNRFRQGWVKGLGWRATLAEKKKHYKILREAGVPVQTAYRIRSWRPTRVKEVIAGERQVFEIESERKRIEETGMKTHPSELEYKRKWRQKPEIL